MSTRTQKVTHRYTAWKKTKLPIQHNLLDINRHKLLFSYNTNLTFTDCTFNRFGVQKITG